MPDHNCTSADPEKLSVVEHLATRSLTEFNPESFFERIEMTAAGFCCNSESFRLRINSARNPSEGTNEKPLQTEDADTASSHSVTPEMLLSGLQSGPSPGVSGVEPPLKRAGMTHFGLALHGGRKLQRTHTRFKKAQTEDYQNFRPGLLLAMSSDKVFLTAPRLSHSRRKE